MHIVNFTKAGTPAVTYGVMPSAVVLLTPGSAPGGPFGPTTWVKLAGEDPIEVSGMQSDVATQINGGFFP
jgi:hypothetical protein